MKRTILFILTLFCFYSVSAQDSSDIALKVKRVYAGEYANAGFDRKANFSNESNILVGSEAELIFSPTLSFKARTAYSSSNGAITHLYFVGKSDLGDLLFGFMPRSAPLLLRPNPVSAEGQTEFLTTRTIPGAAAGAMFRSGGLNFGVFNAGDRLEYNAGLEDSLMGKSICVAGFANSDHFGIGASVIDGNFSETVFGSNSNIGVHVEFKQSNGGILYGDVITDLGFQKAQNWEIGWRRQFITDEYEGCKLKFIVVFGAGHIGQNYLRAYVLVHI